MIDIKTEIPIGHDNAADANTLARWLGVTPRDVRREINKARKDMVILNMQDGYGYFIPTAEENYLVERWVKQEESRLKKHALALRGARDWVRSNKSE